VLGCQKLQIQLDSDASTVFKFVFLCEIQNEICVYAVNDIAIAFFCLSVCPSVHMCVKFSWSL